MWRISICKNKEQNKLGNSTKKSGMCNTHCRGRRQGEKNYIWSLIGQQRKLASCC